MENAYFKLGNYGTGTLWYLSNRGGAFVHFNRLQIAKLEPDGTTWKSRTWMECHHDGKPRVTRTTRLQRRNHCLASQPKSMIV